MTPKEEEQTLRVLSDAFEQATGRAVDLTAWGLDQLVRVLNNPHDVLNMSNALSPGFNAWREGELEARARLIGPLEQLEQARRGVGSGRVMIYSDPPWGVEGREWPVESDFGPLELRVMQSIEAARTPAERQVRKGEGFAVMYGAGRRFALRPEQVHALEETRGTYAAADSRNAHSASDVIDAMRHTLEVINSRNRPVFVIDTAETERGDPFALTEFGRGSLVHEALARYVPPQVAADTYEPAPRRRFKQARAPGEARNPMPPASPFKRRR